MYMAAYEDTVEEQKYTDSNKIYTSSGKCKNGWIQESLGCILEIY